MNYCQELHKLANTMRRYRFPFDGEILAQNGVYVLFEQGETGHGGERIVRTGSHRGDGQLAGRLREHYITENKDRSIFRKNIGRAILNQRGDSFLSDWDKDLTSRKNRERYSHQINLKTLQTIEAEVTNYIRSHFSFVIIPISDKEERLYLEKRVISTVSGCSSCGPSHDWLGLSSPIDKIRESGLWQVSHLYQEPLTDQELKTIENLRL
jgi:hypothetical protein